MQHICEAGLYWIVWVTWSEDPRSDPCMAMIDLWSVIVSQPPHLLCSLTILSPPHRNLYQISKKIIIVLLKTKLLCMSPF